MHWLCSVQLGPRPYYLVNNMDEGELKDKLESCSEGPFSTSHFSISHRGAALMFPEHSKEGYIAAARMGAGTSLSPLESLNSAHIYSQALSNATSALPATVSSSADAPTAIYTTPPTFSLVPSSLQSARSPSLHTTKKPVKTPALSAAPPTSH